MGPNKNITKLLSVAALCCGIVTVPLRAVPLSRDLKQNFSVTETSRVPGAVLKPGAYSIALLDYMTDRSILQVTDAKGKVRATFIGIRRPAAPPGSHAGMNLWSNAPSKQPTFREWVIPSGEALEFAYPKLDAVAIAKVNREQVPAIDPESEGKSSATKLPPNDMEVVTLWLLSTTTVSPQNGKEAIEATRFVPDTKNMASVPAPVSPVAQSSPSVDSASPRMIASAAPPASAVNGEAKARRLPHTAGNLPLTGLLGLMCLSIAGLFPMVNRLRRARG